MGELEYVTRQEFNNTENRFEKDIHENRERINKNSEAITRLETMYESLEELPNAIVALDKTLLIMGENMKAMGEKINESTESVLQLKKAAEKRDEEIRNLDNKSKIDWQVSITNNFWKIFSALLVAGIVIKFIIEHFGG